jgi:SAM-dependent methyltransferase
MKAGKSYSEGFRQRNSQLLESARQLLTGFKTLSKAARHECNLCGYVGRFGPFGDPPRRGAVCANCGSKERQRLIGLWVKANPAVIEGADVLHFAPERTLRDLFVGHGAAYRSADLRPGAADAVLNIENLILPDETVDVVVCSHVLEHVDDQKALKEIHRILRPGAQALLLFPIIEGWESTYANPEHTSEEDRSRYFGQFDHVRMYGRDVRDKIRNTGFKLTEFTAEEPNVTRYGLLRGEKIFIAKKQ